MTWYQPKVMKISMFPYSISQTKAVTIILLSTKGKLNG